MTSSTTPWLDRKLHFIAIGGAGMSGLALIAKRLGAEVTGSDSAANTPYSDFLKSNGITPIVGHDADNVPVGSEIVFSSAIPEDNPERVIAHQRGQKELHRADLLAELTRIKRTIAVCGTHGKTTTSAMIAHVLTDLGTNPSFVIGAEVLGFDTNSHWDDGDWLVVEADESDRSLLKLHSDIAVLTNAEHDHHTTYATVDDVFATFKQFLSGASQNVVVWDQPTLVDLVEDKKKLITFDETTARDAGVELQFPGDYNLRNAAATLEVAKLVGIPVEDAANSLATFAGTARRFTEMGTTSSGAVVIDDYAHHPTEVSAVIGATRELQPKRIVAVFQPHLYSRTQHQAAEFASALATADQAIVTEIYPAREHSRDFPGISGRTIVDTLTDSPVNRSKVHFVTDIESAYHLLEDLLEEGDICLTIGAGNVDDLARMLVKK